MLDKCDGLPCEHCGCQDTEILKPPEEDEWFPSGIARCHACGKEFSFTNGNEDDTIPVDQPAPAVRYTPLRCPGCRSTDVPVQHTRQPVRYHRCRACGTTFKSVEQKE